MSTQRNIFEDVSGDVSRTPTKQPSNGQHQGAQSVVIWLKILFILVAIIIVVGGLTRLTDSGLSITEWAPVTGAVPPLSEQAWQVEFEKYQEIPEFVIQNSAMTLAEFKSIYWWEWGHRLLGRLVGVAWAGGFAFLALRGRIPRGWTGRLVLLGALGGLQGFVGWWMVSSGLSGRVVDVASYRLAIHLGLAFVILGSITWFIQALRRGDADLLQARRRREANLSKLTLSLLVLLFLQVLLGALVAGLDAGTGYTDWPLMGGTFFPGEALNLSPFWVNLFENVAMTQFNHRLLAYICVGLGIFIWLKSRQSALRATRSWFNYLLMAIGVQLLAGILVLVNGAPLGLAVVHQIGAIILWVVALICYFQTLYPRAQTLR